MQTMNDILARAIEMAVANPNPVPVPDTPMSRIYGAVPVEEDEDTFTAAVTAYEHHAARDIKTLADKAMLVKLTRRMFSPYAYDDDATRAAEVAFGVAGAGRFNKHLFKRPKSLVREVNKLFTEAYVYHNRMTLPWETGVNLLRAELYLTYTEQMRKRIDACNAAVAQLAAVWDAEVQADLLHLGALAKPADYPTDIAKYYSIDVRFRPVPTVGDFRVGISDADRESLQKDIADAEAAAAKHVISRMMEPLQRAVEKFAVPIGADGAVFRDSLVENLVEVAERMAQVNISDDPAIAEHINKLREAAGTYARNIGVLRESPNARAIARGKLETLLNDMKGLV